MYHDYNIKCKLTGITDNVIHSQGVVHINLDIGEKVINHNFNIVDEKFPIQTDGILGQDFLKKYLCKIDLETCLITFVVENEEVTLPIHSKIEEASNIIIPGRSEILHRVKLKLTEDSVVFNKEILNGVFVGNSIVPKEGYAHIRILNANNKEVRVKNLNLETEPLSNYHVISQNKKNLGNKRFQELLKVLNIDSKDTLANDALFEIFKEYQDIFHLEGESLSTNNFYRQHLNVNDTNPVYIKNYRLPQTQHEEIDEQVDNLIYTNIIEPSVSPYNSPLLVVPKKGSNDKKKWRLVVDYRQLNKKLVNDKFPLTRLEDVLDRIGRSKYFSTLDMTSSFHQIPLNKESRPLTAFSTNKGHFQFKRLPFGLKISSNSFQRMLTIALSGLDSQAFLYVDDIIVFGCSLKHHNSNLIQVFERLRKYNLKLNASKCVFLKSEVVYLGHLITNEGIKTDPSKYEAIEKYPVPKDSDEVRRFVAFCNYYRRFIKDFAQITKCLNNLVKKGQTFEWNEECQKAFELLKSKLINPPILQYPRFTEKFIITCDSSNYALGAILSQGEVGKDLPISYASKTLSKHDLNKPIIEKELLAIHWGINFFRPYLYGRKFTVVTDHRPLVSLFTHKNPSSKMTRIRLDLSDYDFDIIFKQGKINTNADALSRIKLDSDILKSMIPKNQEDSKNMFAITRGMSAKKIADKENCRSQEKPDHLHIWDCTSMNDVKNIKKLKILNEYITGTRIEINKNWVIVRCSDNPAKYVSAMEKLSSRMTKEKINILGLEYENYAWRGMHIEKFKKIFNKMQTERSENNLTPLKIILYTNPKQITDKIEMQKLIEEYHNTPLGGHLGVRKTLLKLKQRYVWKNMRKLIKNHISNCKSCTQNKQTKYNKEKMNITDTPNTSFETVSIDTVGPLRISNGYRYILTIQCELTKYVVLHPIETKEAINIAKTLVEQFILKYGFFKILKSDRGSEFANELMKNICKIMKIEQKFSAPYHHQSIGALERNHRVLNEFLLNFVEDNEWPKWINYFAFAYNTVPNDSTHFSPYELIFGKLPYLPTDIVKDSTPNYNLDNYANELKIRLKHSITKAKEQLQITKQKTKTHYDKHTNIENLEVGDLVFIRLESRKKSQSPYHGPYKIIERKGINSILDVRGKPKIYHNNSLKKYKQN